MNAVTEVYSGKYRYGKNMDMEQLNLKVVIFIRANQNGSINGTGEYIFDGLKYKGDWKDGKMNGKGTLIHPSGENIRDFKDDKKHGKGYYINPNGMNYEGSYKNDVFHGKGKFIDPNGKVIEEL